MLKRHREDEAGAKASAQEEVIDVTSTPSRVASETMRSDDSYENDSLLDIAYDTYIGSGWLDGRGFSLWRSMMFPCSCAADQLSIRVRRHFPVSTPKGSAA